MVTSTVAAHHHGLLQVEAPASLVAFPAILIGLAVAAVAGAGLGAKAGDLKGGLGSASAVDPASGLQVGALVAVNARGYTTMGSMPQFWAWALEQDGEFGGLPPPPHGLALPVLQLGIADQLTEHGDPAQLLSECGLDARGIALSINHRFPIDVVGF